MNLKSRPSRDDTWIDICIDISKQSKDRSTRVGCVIVGKYNIPLAMGFNGIPRGCNDDVEERHTRPNKYFWLEHGERNAIYNAARLGHALDGAKLYIPAPPCADCSRAIIQVGIVEVICASIDVPIRFHDSCETSIQMLNEAGVLIRFPNSANPITKWEYVNREGWGDKRIRSEIDNDEPSWDSISY